MEKSRNQKRAGAGFLMGMSMWSLLPNTAEKFLDKTITSNRK
jgi:hypothetical protein